MPTFANTSSQKYVDDRDLTLDIRITQAEADIQDVKQDIQQINNDVYQLEQHINTTDNDVSTLANRVTVTENDIGTLQADVAQAQTDIVSHTVRLDDHDIDIADLQADKMDKVPGSGLNTIAVFDGNGQVVDSGDTIGAVTGAFLPLTGGTMTGDIKMDGVSMHGMGNKSQVHVDETATGAHVTVLADQTVHVAGSSAQVDIRAQEASGVTASIHLGAEGNSGIPILSLETTAVGAASGHRGVRVRNLAVPVLGTDAAPKDYVDGVLDGKADKCVPANAGNFAGLDATGNLTDTGRSPADIAAIEGDINTINATIYGIQNLGRSLGSVQNYADLATFTLPPFATVNDYLTVRSDESRPNSPTARYILTDMGPPVVWTFDVDLNINIGGDVMLVPGAVLNNFASFDSLGQVIDSGANANSFVAVKPAVPNNRLAAWDGSGQQKDSGYTASDFAANADLQAEIADRQASELTLSTAIANHTADTTVHVTQSNKDTWNGKMDRIPGGPAADLMLMTDGNGQAQITGFHANNVMLKVANPTDNHVALIDAMGAVKDGGTREALVGAYNSASATKLQTARNIRTNLASTTAASFDGSADVTPGVTGVLPVANGGTGMTSLDSFVISSTPTTINEVGLFPTEQAAIAASTAYPTTLCFYPE